MVGKEIKAAGEIAGDVISGPAIVAMEMHKAAAGRAFDALGIIGAPVRFVHDRISGAAYASARSVLRRLPSRGGAAAALLAPPDATPLAESPLGGIALGALNGAVGDSLKRAHGDLALELSVRHRGRDLPTDRHELAEALPTATSRIAVFVHGLCETDAAWHQLPLSGRTRDRRSYGSRLHDDLGYTPLYIRYNTGLHISDNGRRLSEALEEVVSAWPTHVEEVALVGHSMGGLVSRSACHYAEASEHSWSRHVRHVFCLGTPHLGAPLERAANLTGWALDRLPETRPFARLVNGRSVGIKDLRYGSCVEEDWCDCDPDEFLRDRCREVPFLEGASYYFVGATLSRASDGPLASIVGDLLVQYPSASGSGPKRRIPFEIENGCHVGRANHIQLLNHPAVYDQLVAWLRHTAATTLPANGADAPPASAARRSRQNDVGPYTRDGHPTLDKETTMAKPNRLDVARKTGEIAPATKEGVAEALGVEVSAPQFEKAFGNAAERGLIEQEAPETGGTARWKLSEKGERKLASSGDAD